MEGLRLRVLEGWTRTPARFREDANAEQDAALGGYAERLVVELAQNAADAAGDSPGRLLLRWTTDGLVAANTGQSLTSEGVVSLSTLRASAKVHDRGTAIGRFGVGFAAALAVTDAPVISSREGPSVGWSAAESAALVANIPSLADDFAAREGHVPVLRLPFIRPALNVPDGYDTAVWLPWRDASAAQLAARLLDEIDPTLLLTLDALGELRVERPNGNVVSTCTWNASDAVLDGRLWLGRSLTGSVPEALLQERPTEERGLHTYQVRAFAPADGLGLPAGAPAVLRAPTLTDEPMSLPVVAVASVPLEPTRRRAVRGPLCELILAAAGTCIGELAGRFEDPSPFVPTGLAAGDVDAAIRSATLSTLRESPLSQGIVPNRCSYLDLGDASDSVRILLADEVAGLLPAVWSEPSRAAAVGALGVQRIDTAGAVALLADRPREPSFWHRAYAALAYAPDRDALGALPVPLVDGRLVTGARGSLLPDGPLPVGVDALPVRVVHPDAAHPLLERLGARVADAAALVTDPAVRQAVEASVDDDLLDDGLARAVAALVAESAVSVREHPWLAALALPAEGGGIESAADLVWPGSPMEMLLDPSAGFRRLDPPAWLDRTVARALGVVDRPVVTRFLDIPLTLDADDETGLLDLDGMEEWLAELAETAEDPDAVVPELVTVRDLDAVLDLAGLIALAAEDPDLRASIVQPVLVAGRQRRSYTAWWISRHPIFGSNRPIDCASPEVALLGDLYDAAPSDVDQELLRALGVRTDLAEILRTAAEVEDLLARLGDTRRHPQRDDVVRIHAGLAAAWEGGFDEVPDPPVAVRGVWPGGDIDAVSVQACVAVDAPDLIPLVWAAGRPILLARTQDARLLAEFFDLELASDLEWPRPAMGVTVPVPQEVRDLAANAPLSYQLLDTAPTPWRFVDGTLYATEEGLAFGLAWAAGCWGRRHLFRTALERPAEFAVAALEELAEGF